MAMLELPVIVRRYRRVHRTWRYLRKLAPTLGQDWKLATVESEVRALAWVLNINPDLDKKGTAFGIGGRAGQSPLRSHAQSSRRYLPAEMESTEGYPPLRGARLTRAFEGNPGKRYWLLEVPAEQGQTEYWAAFMPEKYVASLITAIGSALFTSTPADLHTVIGTMARADKPTTRDVRWLIANGTADLWSVSGTETDEDEQGRIGGGAA